MRIIPPSERAAKAGGSFSHRVPKKTLQERMARQAAIERAYCRYLHLECGHYSTLEVDEANSLWRPKRGVTWCENCSEWVAIAKPPTPPDPGNTPLF